MKTIQVTTLGEFTRFIEETCVDQETTLFRGQSCDFPLLPSLARERLVDDVLAVERDMLEEFQRHSAPFLKIVPGTAWEWMALAQHHGLPTRLLDWSTNPLTSLWFAVAKAPLRGRDGVLWMLRPAKEDFPTEAEKDQLACERNVVFAPKDVSERITAQVAWFTVHKAWPGHSQFEPLEESHEFRDKLTKILIPHDRFAHLRFNLSRCGIHHGSIFPGLDGLCAHLRWIYCFMEDEGEHDGSGGR